MKGIEDDLRAWYTRLAENNALSLQDAKRFLNTSGLEEFRWTVEEYIQQAEQLGLSDEIKKKLENASARYHIRRLEAIQLQVEQRLAAATANAEDTILQELTSTVEEISSRTMYEVQKGLNVGFNISQIDGKTVQQLLHTGWSTDGKTFSARLWENQQKLVSTLEQQLTQAIIQGKSLSQVVQQLTKTMESSRFNIARVVYTESAHAIETGKLTAYEELGVDELEIIATLDARTCAVCGDLDGKTVRRTDAVSGVSIPPWHPRCRCTTAPAVDEKYGERIARDENGETYTVPADTTYEQWKEQQEALDGEGTIDTAREKIYNKAADQRQLKLYQEQLKNEPVLENLGSFQEMKYSRPADYADLKGYYEYSRNNSGSDRAFYDAEKKRLELAANGEIRAKGAVVEAPSGITITAISEHAKSQLSKRSMTIEDVQSIINYADFALKQQSGAVHAYYSRDGFAAVDASGVLRTAGRLDNGGQKLYDEVVKILGNNK